MKLAKISYSKNIKYTLIGIGLLVVFSIIFFNHLFNPVLGIFATHEIGINDIWHLNYPFKEFLHQELTHGRIPLWNPLISNGFPVLAEGETGVFNFYNLIAFRFLPTIIAFNLGYVLIFIFSAVGMYLFCRRERLSNLTSIYAGIIYAFGGYFVTHISNFVHLQGASFLPWLMLLGKIILDTGAPFAVLGYAFFASQQILTGFPQATFITNFFVGLYLIYAIIKRKTTIKNVALLVGAISFAAILSSIQIIPTYELMKLSSRSNGVDTHDLLYFKFPFVHFITFILPFFYGNPQSGTYPGIAEFNGSIFWESSGYIGLIPLIMALYAFIKVRKSPYLLFFSLTFIFAAILMLGGGGPLYILLTYPPFSFFRFPSRYMLIFLFSLVYISALGLDHLFFIQNKIQFKKYLGYLVIILALIDLTRIWYGYHPIIPYSDFIKLPETVAYLNSQDHQGVYVYKSNARLYAEFSNKNPGKIARYLNYKNEIIPNSQVTYQIPSPNYYFTLFPRRLGYVSMFIGNTYDFDQATKSSALSEDAIKMLQLRNTTHILSPVPLVNNQVELMTKIPFPAISNQSYEYIYKLNESLPMYNIYTDYKIVSTLEEYNTEFTDKEFDIAKSVILDSPRPFKPDLLDISNTPKVKVIRENPQLKELTVISSQSAILSIATTFYPGWHASLDNKSVNIYPVNLVNQGVDIPAGTHTLKLWFAPNSFKYGSMISIISYCIWLILSILYLLKCFIKK
jgi:hypothetical protein